MKSKKSIYILVAIIIILIGFGIVFIPKKVKEYNHNERKAEIKKSTQEILGNCTSDSFDERRICFNSKLQELRKSNRIVKTQYNLVYNGNKTSLKSEDQGDLVKITKDSSLSFFSCLSNTFLVHWDLTNIYLSLENPLGILICKDSKGGDIIIAPSDLSEDSLNQTVKNLKQTQIK